MAAASHCKRRRSIELPPEIADVLRLKDEFFELSEMDYTQLQRCIEKLSCIIKTFEADFRKATKRSRDAGVMGIVGGATVVAGLFLAPFTFEASAVVAGAGAGAATLAGAGIKSGICSFDKKHQMKQLRKEIEVELKEFQDKINPMA
ncbi:hypothetical protein ABG768_024666 [Culter alburnus]|uniref:Uncharacterized protein n=1 Tax=Culter alburnus TaxID=194366 RepID=A0AAW2ADB2_CULAL